MTLYELTNDWKMLYDMMDDPEVDEETLLDTIEGIDGAIEVKAEGYAKMLKMLDAREEAISSEQKRLMGMKNTIKNRKEWLKGNLQKAMMVTGKTKFQSGLFNFGIQKNPPKVVIDDETQIPSSFLIPQEPKVDTDGIKKWLKEQEGEKSSFAHLVREDSLRIR